MYGRAVWKHTTRITPALVLSLLVVLLLISFVVEPFGSGKEGEHHRQATTSQWILGIYILVLHFLSSLFPIRAFCALGNVIHNIRKVAVEQNDETPSNGEQPLLFAILIPTYKEDVETLSQTLSVLAAHSQARLSYHVSR